ncbi:MAG TPA: FtsW/RodA/SpoVE family cell cycle protein [Vicinamibacterales bacterium]
MAVTYVSAVDRDTRRTTEVARHVDLRHGLLAITSTVALLAIALTYAGTLSRTSRSVRLQADLRSSDQKPVDITTLKDATLLEPALEPIFPMAGDRRRAAAQLYQFIRARLDAGERIANVGMLRRATTDGKTAVLTSDQLTAVKPAIVVRTENAFRTQILTWGAAYLASVWAVALIWWIRRTRGDYVLLSAAHLLTALGFAVLLSRQDPVRDTLLFVRYAQGAAVGFLIFAWVSSLDLRRTALAGLSYLPLIGAFVLSAVLVLFGSGPAGSNAKVNLGPVQPVEAIRLLIGLFLAGYFARRWELLRDVRGRTVRAMQVPAWLDVPRADYVLPLLAGIATALLFFFLQKDLGPALFVSCVFLATYAVARNRVGLALGGFAILIAGFYLGYALNISSTLTARVAMWRSSWDNAVRGGDQIAQAIWGMSTGGLFGTGLGLGDTRYLPAGHTDLVLAAIGEELGFVGLLVVAAAFAIIAARGFNAAMRAIDDYGFFLAMVVTLFLALPVLIMAAGILGLAPLTGIVTPFLSFGGSAMIANFIALGVIVAIRNAASASHVLPVTKPFRIGVTRLAATLGTAAAVLLVFVFNAQVLHADEFAVRPHLGLQGDGVRRFQYNPRVLDVLASIPRGSVLDRRGLPLATSDASIAKKARDAYKKAGIDADCVVPVDERCYPLDAAAFHLLGDARDRRNWGASNTAYVERDSQDHLRGFDDHSVVVKAADASGHNVATMRRDYRELLPLLHGRYAGATFRWPFAESARLPGTHDITLTIDAPLQARVARILEKYAERSATGHAAAVVLDPDTGDILATASYPAPDVGAVSHVGTAFRRHGATGDDDETDALFDRARFGLYPPGSTFKVVTAAAALREDAALGRTTFMCALQPDGRAGAKVNGWGVIRDDELDRDAHGTIDMHDGIVHSCNAYFAQLAVRVGAQPMLDTAHLLGISIARDDSLSRVRATLAHAGYGQGDVVATPLRMARVAAAIASNGVLRDTRIEKSPTPAAGHVLLKPEAASLLGRDLRDAVLTGTGKSLSGHAWRIAGKTGTAEVTGAPSHAWFIGYAPFDRAEKRVAFAVLIENAGYGGRAAAPAAGEIVTAAALSGLVK